MNHYKWLEENLPTFFEKMGINPEYSHGVIAAHGDKCEMARTLFKRNGLKYCHGVAIYLLLSFEPYANQVRQTVNGWIDPFEWIVNNKDKFEPYLS
jgi:hypothetical protein